MTVAPKLNLIELGASFESTCQFEVEFNYNMYRALEHSRLRSASWTIDRAVHSEGAEGAAAPAKVFEFAELFLVAILVRNHKKID